MFNLGSMLNLGSTEPVIGRANTIVTCSAAELFRFLGAGPARHRRAAGARRSRAAFGIEVQNLNL